MSSTRVSKKLSSLQNPNVGPSTVKKDERNRVVTTSSSNPRVTTSFYNALPLPARALLYIPVTVVQVVQEIVFPSILFQEGRHVFRQNFGFSRECIINNLLLSGMVICTASRLWINPWFDKEHEAVHATWHKINDKGISDESYYQEFYSCIWNFTKSLFALISSATLNHILEALLSSAITFKKQCEFVRNWLSDFSTYGVNATNRSGGTEHDKEKANLHPVQLFEDIGNQNALISLCNSRLNTLVDCITAFYTLAIMSPPMMIPLYCTTIIVPKFIFISLVYCMAFNALLWTVERPLQICYQKMNQLKDKIIRQITNIDGHAESIVFHRGETFEGLKLLDLLALKREQAVKYDFLSLQKKSITDFLENFEWVLPILACVEIVRKGDMKLEEVDPAMHNYVRLLLFYNWSKKNFLMLNTIRASIDRLKLFDERLEAWKIKQIEIDSKIKDSDKITFSGSVYADEKRGMDETLLAKGRFTLAAGSITHLSVPSGGGKTTLFRSACGVWNEFDGEWAFPKKHTIFLPSEVYILGPDEPLYQTICYPVKNDNRNSHLSWVQGWLRQLNIPEKTITDLTRSPLCENETSSDTGVSNYALTLSEGEGKRMAFCNMLLKLHTTCTKFLILDEPFKGIDEPVQKTMCRLLLESIGKGSCSEKCTILFSHHGETPDFNTHILSVNKNKYYTLSGFTKKLKTT